MSEHEWKHVVAPNPNDYNNTSFRKNKKVCRKSKSIQNNLCDTAVCGQLLSVAFGLEGRAGPANPT